MPNRLRLVLGDDHHLMVESLRAALKKRHEVVAVAHTAQTILDAVRDHQPDVLLLDLSLPERNGLEIIPDVRIAAPLTRIIVVTMHLDRALADAALRAGAQAFVPKDAGLEELERAIKVVVRGATFISTRVPPTTNRVTLLAAHAALAQLTPRQHEIVQLIAEGLTTPEIAAQLGLSVHTVTFHRGNIRDKLGVDSAMDLMRYAVLLKLDGADAAEGDPTGINRRERTPED
ncbi:MAG: response regulator transcription factor [Gemmatimonadetes bacterium]|nr:response regulator transcription factor [Gemmatimonadota bacterium]